MCILLTLHLVVLNETATCQLILSNGREATASDTNVHVGRMGPIWAFEQSLLPCNSPPPALQIGADTFLPLQSLKPPTLRPPIACLGHIIRRGKKQRQSPINYLAINLMQQSKAVIQRPRESKGAKFRPHRTECWEGRDTMTHDQSLIMTIARRRKTRGANCNVEQVISDSRSSCAAD